MSYPKDYRRMAIPNKVAIYITEVLADGPDECSLICKDNKQAMKWRYIILACLKDKKERKHKFCVKDNLIFAVKKEAFR